MNRPTTPSAASCPPTALTAVLVCLLAAGATALARGDDPASDNPAADDPAATAAHGDAETGFRSLFDGRSLQQWEGDPQWFRVDEGSIVAGSLQQRIPHNVFLCTEQTYGDFELRLEARLVGPGNNAGVQFRTRRIEGSSEVSGYQADMGAAGGRPVWGALYDESRRRKMLAEPDAAQVQQVLREGDWNELRIRCRGPRIEIFLNGLQTVDYTETDPQIESRGIIGLQIHGGPPAEARYRNVRIKPL